MTYFLNRSFAVSCALIALGAAGPATAAGFYLQEQSSYHQGMSLAGAAADPVDASTVFFNPAGMTRLSGPQLQVGASLISPTVKLKDNGTTVTTGGTTESISPTSGDGGNPYNPTPLPHAYFAYPAGDEGRTWIGFGISTPFGLANKYEHDSFARYDSTKSSLKTMDMASTVAYRVNDWLSVGGGLNYQMAEGHLENALPNPATAAGTPSPDSDGLQDLSGDTATLGYNLGLLLAPCDTTRVGLHYRSAITHDLEGRVIVRRPTAAGGTLVRIPAQAKLKLPDIATLAVAHDLSDRLTVQGHAIWYGWSKFDDLPVDLAAGTDSRTEQNYKNTLALAIGAKYRLSDDWILKAGYQYDPTPTRDGFRNTRTPDGNRHWFSGGATYKISDRVDLDLALTYIDIAKGDINLTRTFTTGTASINGTTEGSVTIGTAGLVYRF